MHIHKHLKQTKKKKEELKTVDKLMYVVSFAYPLTVLPQLIKIYTTHDVDSFALSSWLMYVVFQVICVAYAFSRKLKPLIIEGALWLAFYVLVVIAIFLYQ